MIKCEGKPDCLGIAVVVSIIIGIIAAFLTITGVIFILPVFLWVMLGTAIGYIAVSLLSVAIDGRNTAYHCSETTLGAALISAVGTVLFSLILLAIPFAPASVVGAIFNGLLFFSFFTLLTSTVCLVKCLAKTNS